MCHYHLVTVLLTSGINTQCHKSAKEYVVKFNEFLFRCNTFNKKGQTQFLSRFRAKLREVLRAKLLTRGVTQLEKAYVLVQDLDSVRTNHTFKSHDYRASMSRPFPSPQPNRSSTQTPSHRNDIKGKSLEWDNKNKGLEFPKVSFTIKCYKCQCYVHLDANCPGLSRITIIDGTPIEAT